jgi:hypothetical protein
MKPINIILTLFISITSFAQSFTDKITREYTFEKPGIDNALMVANINGGITVAGYDGDKIRVEVTRTIKAKTPERLEKGKAQIKLGVMDLADTIILYTQGICSQFGKKDMDKEKGDGPHRQSWGYLWNNQEEDCKEWCDYTFDYVIKVPEAVHLILSTVNQGDIKIENLKGGIVANNVNGSITLSNISREANASTINGNVEIAYSKNPEKACRFYTLNGDINAWFQKGLSANMSFESFNGELFTNVPQLEPLPVEVEKSETPEGTRFKVNGNRFKVGKGGVILDFETFNGDVYIKEKI